MISRACQEEGYPWFLAKESIKEAARSGPGMVWDFGKAGRPWSFAKESIEEAERSGVWMVCLGGVEGEGAQAGEDFVVFLEALVSVAGARVEDIAGDNVDDLDSLVCTIPNSQPQRSPFHWEIC